MNPPWQVSDPCIAAGLQPALVRDFAARFDLHQLALPPVGNAVTPEDYLRQLWKIERALGSADTSFLLGQQLLPGATGLPSRALAGAGNLGEAVEVLVRHAHVLCPLLSPRWRREGGRGVLYWTDNYGAGSQLGFLVEMHFAAVTSCMRWLAGRPLDWEYCFSRTAPRETAQHEVHLGQALRFGCHLDAMLVDAAELDRPWPRADAGAVQAAMALPAAGTPILSSLYAWLQERAGAWPTLEQAAAELGMSPATFKRRLARHGTHFQAELDMVRTHLALHLFHTRGMDNESAARYFGFHDAPSFRRSFKRWTGITPSLLRAALGAAA